MVINMDSLDQASDAQPTLEGAPQDAPREACVPPEDGIPIEGSPGGKGVVVEAPLEVFVAPLFSTRLISTGPRRLRMPDRLLLTMPRMFPYRSGSILRRTQWLLAQRAPGKSMIVRAPSTRGNLRSRTCATSTPLSLECHAE